MPGKIVPVLN